MKYLAIFFGGLYFLYLRINQIGNPSLSLSLGIFLAIWAWMPSNDDLERVFGEIK